MAGNRIKGLIERHLLAPAYFLMILGLLIRSVALVLSVAIPYGSWPIVIRILVEGFAAFGMVGCADIALSAASSSAAKLEHQLDALRASVEFMPNARLSGDRYQREKERLDAQRERAAAGLSRELVKEHWAMGGTGSITVLYGILFALTVLNQASLIAVAIEVVGVAAIPFITWYFSAQYKEETAAPEESAKSLALASVDNRLGASKERLGKGEETTADLDLLEAAMVDSPYHKKLVGALRRPDTRVVYVSTPDIYKLFGVRDSSGQATIRRIVRKAGETHQHGVIADPQSGGWRTPKSSLIEMFPQYIGGVRAADAEADTQRTPASKKRTREADQAAPVAVFSEQGSDSARAALVPGSARWGVTGAPMSPALAEPMR